MASKWGIYWGYNHLTNFLGHLSRLFIPKRTEEPVHQASIFRKYSSVSGTKNACAFWMLKTFSERVGHVAHSCKEIFGKFRPHHGLCKCLPRARLWRMQSPGPRDGICHCKSIGFSWSNFVVASIWFLDGHNSEMESSMGFWLEQIVWQRNSRTGICWSKAWYIRWHANPFLWSQICQAPVHTYLPWDNYGMSPNLESTDYN